MNTDTFIIVFFFLAVLALIFAPIHSQPAAAFGIGALIALIIILFDLENRGKMPKP